MPSIAEILDQDIDQEKTASARAERPSHDIEKIAQELDLFDEIFPGDKAVFGGEKTASQEKVAYADRLGQRAYAYCAERFDRRITKIASELEELAMAEGIMAPQSQAPQRIPNDANPAADASPRNPSMETPYSLIAGAEAGAEGQIGHEEQQSLEQMAADPEKVAAATLKHILKIRHGR